MPGALRVTEVHLDVGIQAEALMICHFLAAIPGQRFVEFSRQLVCMLDERVDDRPGVFAGDSDQHHVTRMAFNQGRDLAVIAADEQVTFPVARNRSILD